VRKRRKALDMTQADLAACVPCSLGMIRKIEQDERRPSEQISLRLAECFNIPSSERPMLIKVARRERSVDRLASVTVADLPALEQIGEPVTSPTYSLPAQSSPFIGRSAELAQIGRLLADPGCHLLTLHGLGGAGKTRLAVEAANVQTENFRHGVVFVSLASLSSPESMIAAIGESLGVAIYEDQNPAAQLLSYLQPRQLMLVLDGIDHPPVAAALVTKILQTAQGVKALVTSQERLNLREEWLFEVRGLSIDSDRLRRAEDSDAVTLFVQNARRVWPDFSLSDDNWASVVRVCELLEGMPLAIELAAAWVRTLSCQEIAIELEKSLDLLATSQIETSTRHASVRMIFDHAWNSLSEPQRDVLSKLSVFHGPFQREAASQVAGGTLEMLADLADKSLLRIDSSKHYEIDTLLRKYATEKLAKSPARADLTREAHSRYFGQMLHDKEQALKGIEQAQALHKIANALDDVRLGWQWALERREWGILENYLESLFVFYETRSGWTEGVDKLATLVESMAGAETQAPEEVRLHGRALAYWGTLAAHLGRYQQASELLLESLSILIDVDAADVAFASSQLGALAGLQGCYDQASQRVEDALAIYTALGDQWGITNSLAMQGSIAQARGEDARSGQLYHASLAIHKQLGNQRGIAQALVYLGNLARSMGNSHEAQRQLHQSQEIFVELGDKSGQGTALKNLAKVALMLGQFAESKRGLQESLAMFRAIGCRQGMIDCLDDLANLARVMGHYDESIAYYYEGLRFAMSMGATHLALNLLIGLARVLAKQGKEVGALRLLGLALAHPDCDKVTRDKAQSLIVELEIGLSDKAISDGLAQGQMLELEAMMPDLLSLTQ